ncbi:hypothetical protein MAR_037741 [Mya arenaria]|uniref:Uncharacterized protein n=1 Tax=Mya arenaria TaxID=6604 RepID=A0ABY7FSR2_MYAAR|nr:hypothetical protein MAR_037741 [Mya arenaria]
MAQPEDIRKPLGRANTHVEEESIDIIGEASNSGDDDTKIDKEEPRQLTGATEQSSECLLPDTPTAAFGETINRGDDEAPVDTFTYIAVGGRKRTPSLSLEHEDAGCDEETIPINDVVEQPPECIPKEDFVDVIGVIGDSGDDQATVPTKKKGGRKRTSSLTIVSADTKIDEEETHQLIGATDQSSEFPLQEKSTNVLGEATNSEDNNVSVATVPNIQKGDRRRTSSLTIVNDDTKIDEEEQHQLAGATEQTSECLLRTLTDNGLNNWDAFHLKFTNHADCVKLLDNDAGHAVCMTEPCTIQMVIQSVRKYQQVEEQVPLQISKPVVVCQIASAALFTMPVQEGNIWVTAEVDTAAQVTNISEKDDIEEKSTSHRDASDERNSGEGQTVGVQECKERD